MKGRQIPPSPPSSSDLTCRRALTLSSWVRRVSLPGAGCLWERSCSYGSSEHRLCWCLTFPGALTRNLTHSGPGCALDLVFQVPVTVGSPCPRRCHTLQGSVTSVPDSVLYLAVSWPRTGVEGNNTSRTTNFTLCSCEPRSPLCCCCEEFTPPQLLLSARAVEVGFSGIVDISK